MSDTTAPTDENPNFGVNDLTATPEKTFRDYALDDRLVDALEADGKTHPFPIQSLTMPMSLQGHDIIGQARTGTGKTLAFGLPLLNRIDTSLDRTQALVVVPTRELCLQVHADLSVGKAMGVRTQAVYGGVGYDEQTEALTSGVHVVVGTPGRLLDMLNRGILDLSGVTELVLDEADEMLDMGFLPDVERLLDAAGTASDSRHSMLFSATMPASVVKLGRRYMDKPTFMRADTEDHETAPTVDQYFFQVFRMDKPRVLARVLQQPGRGNVYVFCRTKAMVDRLVRELEDLGVKSIAIHGDIRQASREKNMDIFRDGDISVLVATEVAARGLDVDNVTHVVNYDCPDDEKMYLHRIGRTARAGQRGVAVTLFEHSEAARASMIRKAVDPGDELQVEEIFSTSDRLTELFDLPDTTPWAHLAKSGGGSSRSSSKGSAGGREKGSSGGREKGSSGRDGGSRSSGRDGGSRSSGGRENDSSGGRGKGSSDGRGSGRSDDRGGARAKKQDDRGGSSRDARGGRGRRPERDDQPVVGKDVEVETGPSRSVDDLVAERAAARRARRGSRGRSEQSGGASRSEQRGSESRSRRSEQGGGRSSERRSDSGGGRSSSSSAGDDQPRGGARSRSRRQSSGGSSTDSGDGGSDRGGGRRSASSSRRGGRTRGASDGSGGGSAAGRSGRDRGGEARGGEARGGEARGGDGGSASGRSAGGSRGKGKGRNKGSGGTGRGGNARGRGSGRNGNGNQRRGGRSSNGDGGGGQQAVPGVVHARAGEDARGDGRPRLARRVEVEHLP